LLLGSGIGGLITKVTTVEGKGRKGMILSVTVSRKIEVGRTRGGQLGRKVESSVGN
jgi:hypothetical protein